MIIKMKEEQIDRIMDIWLKTNVKAHCFIPESYWINHYNLVQTEYIPNSDTFVYIDDDGILKGFISVMADTLDTSEDFTGKSGMIGALFVAPEYQGEGFGGQLLNYCKSKYDKLTLKVYSENERAFDFYESYGFVTKYEQLDTEANHLECIMAWSDEQDWYNLISTIQC